MRRDYPPTWLCFLCILLSAAAAYPPSSQLPDQHILDDGQPESSARATTGLNFSSASPHIFSSLRFLLQQWPNTFFPNGHSIVPCEIPAYTNLYHGRIDALIPPGPEWFAFDIEMSYGIMGSMRNSHMLTYQTTGAVKCLYFDGMSAALFGSGQLDSQMAFLYGNTSGPPMPKPGLPQMGPSDEYQRAHDLCKWVEINKLGGLGWGVEGMVRMNAGFELIWCNFSSPSIRLLSHLNVTAPLMLESSKSQDQTRMNTDPQGLSGREQPKDSDPSPPSKSLYPLPSSTTMPPVAEPSRLYPPGWGGNWELEPFMQSQFQEWFRSATWHYGASGMGPGRGESRVKLLTCGFMSYYNTIFTSIATERASLEHEALNLSASGIWLGPGPAGNRTIALLELARRRRNHTLAAIDPTEAPMMNNAIASFLRQSMKDHGGQPPQCSDMDWTQTSQEIALRYSGRLREVLHSVSDLPSHTSNSTATRIFLAMARSKAHALLLPFLEYPMSTTMNERFQDHNWSLHSLMGKITMSRCKYAYTRLFYDSDGNELRTNGHEKTLIEATEEVLDAICSSILRVGFGIEREWIFRYNTPNTTLTSATASLQRSAEKWKHEVEELMAWLGWASDETRCEELCARDEYCSIPMWPLSAFGGGHRRRRGPYHYPPGNGTHPPRDGPPRDQYGSRPPRQGLPPNMGDSDGYLWTPKCVKISG